MDIEHVSLPEFKSMVKTFDVDILDFKEGKNETNLIERASITMTVPEYISYPLSQIINEKKGLGNIERLGYIASNATGTTKLTNTDNYPIYDLNTDKVSLPNEVEDPLMGKIEPIENQLAIGESFTKGGIPLMGTPYYWYLTRPQTYIPFAEIDAQAEDIPSDKILFYVFSNNRDILLSDIVGALSMCFRIMTQRMRETRKLRARDIPLPPPTDEEELSYNTSDESDDGPHLEDVPSNRPGCVGNECEALQNLEYNSSRTEVHEAAEQAVAEGTHVEDAVQQIVDQGIHPDLAHEAVTEAVKENIKNDVASGVPIQEVIQNHLDQGVAESTVAKNVVGAVIESVQQGVPVLEVAKKMEQQQIPITQALQQVAQEVHQTVAASPSLSGTPRIISPYFGDRSYSYRRKKSSRKYKKKSAQRYRKKSSPKRRRKSSKKYKKKSSRKVSRKYKKKSPAKRRKSERYY